MKLNEDQINCLKYSLTSIIETKDRIEKLISLAENNNDIPVSKFIDVMELITQSITSFCKMRDC